ncbi:efflux RND transporter permease subunit [Limnoglobus roseus]|uniref:AcrB/AcrD/AcrF family protein n=1 Tax=Limnoglobus roseus TaxID=2598579 RepID=A0A5C1A5B6_9BACT|nr:efflux RND transporter permease subunit [Limnoglobus roseus]QEL13216.1 AcrB/AcrD/AcrF family protein [Limnoglobus roseus]
MRLSDLAIKNPVFAVVLAAALLVFGSLAYRSLGVSQFPELDFPVVSITTYYDSASPDIMDHDVTDVIEDAVSQVEGIDYVQSQSSYGVSSVTVYFRLDKNVDVCMQDVRNAVSAAAGRLPTEIDPPVISKLNFNKFPVIWLGVHGKKPLKALNEFVDTKLKKEVQTVNGCGGVMFGGLRQRTMRVWLDRDKLRGRNQDALDAFQAIRDQHVEMPAGYLDGSKRESDVRTMGEAKTAGEFGDLTMMNAKGQLVNLTEYGTIEDGMADKRSFARYNREPTVGVGVMRATGANVVQVCEEVKAKLPALQKLAAQEGIEVSVSTDFSLFIKDDIEEVKEALVLGVALTAFVTFIFLGSFGTTMNVCVAIPTSLIGTFIAIKVLGFTVNFMTLLALSLSVGVVVDDAILVLENIYRRMELGEKRRAAAINGAREISFAAIAATLSIVAIFLPVAFMQGSIGAFFYQFGITVTVSVLLSLVIALTVTPMLCSLFLTVKHPGQPEPRRALIWRVLGFPFRLLTLLVVWPTNKLLDLSSFIYLRVLRFALWFPWPWLVAGGLIAAAAGVFVVGSPRLGVRPIGRELVPSEDQNRFVVNVICPISTNIEYVEEVAGKAEALIADIKDPESGEDIIASLFCTISFRPGSLVTEGTIFVRLVPSSDRSLTQTDVMNEVRKRLSGVAGMRPVVLDLSTQGFTPTRGFPVNFAVQGSDFDTITQLSERIRLKMIESGVVTDVNTDFRPGMQEVQIIPDREKAAARNVSMRRLAFVLAVGTGGFRDGRFTPVAVGSTARRYDVRLRYQESQRSAPDAILDDFVKNEDGKLIPLRDVTTVKVISTLPTVHRYNHQRKVELTANMAPGTSQGEAISRSLQIAEQVRDEMGLSENYRFVPLGNASAMATTMSSMWGCLTLGFVFAYMILGVQFKSFVHPLTVLLAVPFGVTGALATLWWYGDTLNMMSMIGLVLLAGLVKKNSIVLVDYANQLRRRKGVSPAAAMLEAGRVRLRPILMTSIATIVGAIPLAIGVSAGSETRAPLARSIIGGSILATLVTLIVVPVFYCVFERFMTWLARQYKAESPGTAVPGL